MQIDIRLVNHVVVLKPVERQLYVWAGVGLKKALSSLEIPEGRQVVLNLSAIESLDSEGVSALILLAKQVGGKGKVVVCQVSEAVRALLTLTRLGQLFPIFPTEEDAIAALLQRPRPKARPQEIQLVTESSLDNLSLLSVAVRALAESLSLSQVDAYQIELCAVEAVTNAIIHAYGRRPGNPIQLIFAVYPEKLALMVCDEGQEMDRAAIPSIDFDVVDLQQLPESGMGLFLIHRIMDEVTYISRRGKNILTMVKNFRETA